MAEITISLTEVEADALVDYLDQQKITLNPILRHMGTTSSETRTKLKSVLDTSAGIREKLIIARLEQ